MKPLITVCGLWIAVIHSAHAQWFIEAGAGAGFYQHNQTTTFEAFDAKTSSFITTGQAVSDAYQLGIGKQFAIEHSFINMLSVSTHVYWLRQLKRDGQVTTSQSDYNFKMPLSSYRLMGNMKLNFGRAEKLSPYVIAGVGIAINTTKAFTANSSVDGYNPIHFKKNNRTGFAYQAGLGLDYKINRNWQANLGYLYSNAGKAGPDKLRVNMGELQPANIKFDLSTQEVYLGLRYVFG